MTLSWRKSLLVICKILWLFVDTLFAHDILLLSTDNLTQPTQMQLSKKQEILAEFFSSVLKSRSNFEHFEQKVTIIGYIIPKVQTAKDVVR